MIATAANTARQLVRSNPEISVSELIKRISADTGTSHPVASRAVQIAFPYRS